MILIIIGVISGVISGMGIGGGTFLIPALTIVVGIEQKTAQTINLLYFVPTATIALINHVRCGRIEKRLLVKLIIGGVIGAIVGALIAMRVDSSLLKSVFGWFLIIMGVLEIYKGVKAAKDNNKK